jgi:acetolactate synthase-1/2/3 large subunit
MMVQAMMEQPWGVVSAESRKNSARVMLETFAKRGIRAAFGIPGGLISPLYDALADVPQIRNVTVRHEGMAGYAAMGHAVATGLPALVMTTSGPGLTNAITGIAAAYVEELPLVVVAGEVPTDAQGRGALQDGSPHGIDTMAMVRSITRWRTRIEAPGAAVGAVEQAVRIATGDRPGPVLLSLPFDVANTAAPSADMVIPPAAPVVPELDREACRELAELLMRARRPLMVVGNGARGAASEVRLLAERLAIPVVTTPHAKGLFPESHGLHLGVVGFGGHPSAAAYIESAPDVVLIVGSRLGECTTNGWSVPLSGTYATVQIDRNPLLIGRNYPVTLGLVADAQAALSAIVATVPRNVAPICPSSQGLRRRPEVAGVDRPLQPGRVVRALESAFPHAFWTCDQGEHTAHAIHYLPIDEPDQFRTMIGLAAMGSGIGLALGAKCALPDRVVVGICGDGCFAMHAGEILTCVESGIDVVLAVFNDGRYNMVNHGFAAVFGRTPTTLPHGVADIAGVARAFGAVGVRVETADHLAPTALRRLVSLRRPVVLDIRIDPTPSLSAHSRSAAFRRPNRGVR